MLVHAGNTPAPSSNGLLSTALYDFKGEKTYALEGAVACCAVGINWFRDSLGLFETSPEISDLAARRGVENTTGAAAAGNHAPAGTWDRPSEVRGGRGQTASSGLRRRPSIPAKAATS